jgi:hypothetical protein
MKSTDGGASWIRLGSGYPVGNTGNASQLINQWINVVTVDPANSNILYLASTQGCFRSIDGGRNWTQGTNAAGDARSLVLDASSPTGSRILYAGLSGQGVFQSTDGGQNWTLILSGATAVVSAAIGATGGIGKVVVAIAPPTSPPNALGVQVLYASFEGTNGAPDPVGVFRSIDQGANWNLQNPPPSPGMPTGTQRGYSFHMAVDPASPGDGNADIIYFGTVRQARSNDSGINFTPIGTADLHADTHAWAFFPRPSPAASDVFCGNDGGLYRSTNNGANWTSLSAGGLQTGLFYNLDVRPDNTAITVGTLQDNQVQTTAPGSGPGWLGTAGGDGFDVAYDGTISQRVYCTTGCVVAVRRSNDDGVNWTTLTLPWTGTETGSPIQNCYMPPITTDPSTGGVVYVSGSQNLWQSTDGGNTWRRIGAFAGAGNVNVADTNGNNVVIAVGSQVWVSTNALAATVGPPSGVVFNLMPALPNRTVARAIFDPNDPTVIYAVLGGFNGGPGQIGHVFRISIGDAAWTDISPTVNSLTLGSPPEQVDLPFTAIALDGADTPTTIYVGTDFGVLRSMNGGTSWYILDDIHIPNVPVTDLILRQPAGVLRAATYGRGAFDFVKPTGPAIAVNLQNNLTFGIVCGGPTFLTLEIFNVGVQDLLIYSVERLMGSAQFTVLGAPGTPLTILAGDHVDFTVQYSPTTTGTPDAATIRIRSNDPGAPAVDLLATGARGSGSLQTVIANQGSFGSVCLDLIADETLTINNNGPCPLSILGITSSSPEFSAPNALSYPLIVSAGVSIDVAIRFQPISFGSKSATITIFSDDPAGPHQVAVSGIAPAPRLALIIPNSGNFGNTCVGSFSDQILILNNAGRCLLTLANISSSSTDFLAPQVSAYPVTIEAGGNLPIPVRFQPTSFGTKSATITVSSDDPAGSRTITVSGFAPSGKLAVTGSTSFGGVTACCCADRTLSICNTGDCDLHVRSVRFKRNSRYWKVLHNPFPATLHAGSCLSVVIRYKATEKCPRCCELIIESDDPNTPVRILELLAYTIWDPCGCKGCCEDCRKGCCDKPHRDPCCRQGYPCCCEDEDEEGEP